jgi:dTDP-4-dehydrorhamnose 3,5-epimerase-like enzyme
MLARYVMFPVKGDDDGWLVAIEGQKNIPFAIKRAYYIFGTRAGVRRGRHAHRTLQQMMVCMTGSCKVLLDNGKHREEVLLASNGRGLFIDPMIWHEMYEFSSDCVLLVLADGWYEVADYIRDYGAFKAASGNAP